MVVVSVTPAGPRAARVGWPGGVRRSARVRPTRRLRVSSSRRNRFRDRCPDGWPLDIPSASTGTWPLLRDGLAEPEDHVGRWAPARRSSKSARVPKTGSTSVWSEMSYRSRPSATGRTATARSRPPRANHPDLGRPRRRDGGRLSTELGIRNVLGRLPRQGRSKRRQPIVTLPRDWELLVGRGRARSRATKFGRELLPDLRHLTRHRRVGSRVPRVDRVERCHQDRGGGQAAEPLVIGRHDTPRRPPRAGLAQHGLEGRLVVLPVAPLPDVAGGELPVLLRAVDALEKPLGLLPLGQVQQDLDDTDPVVDQVALPVTDLPVAAGPDPVIARDSGDPLRG